MLVMRFRACKIDLTLPHSPGSSFCTDHSKVAPLLSFLVPASAVTYVAFISNVCFLSHIRLAFGIAVHRNCDISWISALI